MKTMKFINLRVLPVLVLAILSLSSCLKDPRYIDYSASPPLIEFPLAAYNNNQTQLVAITAAMTSTNGTYTLPVTVNLASAKVLSVPTTFTISIDNSLLTSQAATGYTTTFTAKNQVVTPATTTTPIPAYFPLPAADYTTSGFSGTIPAGARTAIAYLTFNPSLIGTTIKNYALRLVITSGSQQISNYNITTLLVQAQ
jgi:hypothetical protein